MSQDNEIKQDVWEEPEQGWNARTSTDDPYPETLVLRRYELNERPNGFWPDIRMLINEVEDGTFDFEVFLEEMGTCSVTCTGSTIWTIVRTMT